MFKPEKELIDILRQHSPKVSSIFVEDTETTKENEEPILEEEQNKEE